MPVGVEDREEEVGILNPGVVRSSTSLPSVVSAAEGLVGSSGAEGVVGSSGVEGVEPSSVEPVVTSSPITNSDVELSSAGSLVDSSVPLVNMVLSVMIIRVPLELVMDLVVPECPDC